MKQILIDQMCAHEYTHLLAYGDPEYIDNTHTCEEDTIEWISTMDSMMCPVMTYGYHVAL